MNRSCECPTVFFFPFAVSCFTLPLKSKLPHSHTYMTAFCRWKIFPSHFSHLECPSHSPAQLRHFFRDQLHSQPPLRKFPCMLCSFPLSSASSSYPPHLALSIPLRCQNGDKAWPVLEVVLEPNSIREFY